MVVVFRDGMPFLRLLGGWFRKKGFWDEGSGRCVLCGLGNSGVYNEDRRVGKIIAKGGFGKGYWQQEV